MADMERNYLRDLVYRLREELREAAASDDDFARGRAFAFGEVLSIMQNQTISFQMRTDDILLEGFDPFALVDQARNGASAARER